MLPKGPKGEVIARDQVPERLDHRERGAVKRRLLTDLAINFGKLVTLTVTGKATPENPVRKLSQRPRF